MFGDDADELPAATLCHLVRGATGNGQPGADNGATGNGQPGADNGETGNGQPGDDSGATGNGQPGDDNDATGNGQPGDDNDATGDETLLIRKKRGVGSGQWVGPGGKVEAGETPRECVIREVREEVGIEVLDPEKAGVFVYRSDGWDAVVHVFRATEYAGTPEETEEADPAWFPVDDLPFDEMWQTDREWLPVVLGGGTFRGRFVYSDGEPEEVTVETGVSLSTA